jgi:hypothetical protein
MTQLIVLLLLNVQHNRASVGGFDAFGFELFVFTRQFISLLFSFHTESALIFQILGDVLDLSLQVANLLFQIGNSVIVTIGSEIKVIRDL